LFFILWANDGVVKDKLKSALISISEGYGIIKQGDRTMSAKGKKALPSREESVQKNIEAFRKLSASQKIRALEKQRKIVVYLRTLKDAGTAHEISK